MLFISKLYLLWLQVANNCADVGQDFLDKRHHFPGLHLNEMAATFLCYLYEGVARHVLNAVVGFCNKQHITYRHSTRDLMLSDRCARLVFIQD